MSKYHRSNLWWPSSLLLLSISFSSSSQSLEKCPQGQVLDLNQQCVDRFRPPDRQKCLEIPEIEFGGHEIRLDGRMAVFWCDFGWTLVPSKSEHAMCKLGQWDRAFPKCIRPGCQRLQSIDEDLVINLKLDKALAVFECRHEHQVVRGERVLGCNGHHWNGSVPFCETLEVKNGVESLQNENVHANSATKFDFGMFCLMFSVIWSVVL